MEGMFKDEQNTVACAGVVMTVVFFGEKIY